VDIAVSGGGWQTRKASPWRYARTRSASISPSIFSPISHGCLEKSLGDIEL